jgi:hypothetical protein
LGEVLGLGDVERRVLPGVCDEVAWCRSDGGAAAIAFAFARLAAIAAAILDFLGACVALLFEPPAKEGSGQAFSSCFFAVPSRLFRITMALSGHIEWNVQNMIRLFSLTAGLESASAFFTDFSRTSRPPAFSMLDLARAP